MNLQLIAIINEFLSKPSKDSGLDSICENNLLYTYPNLYDLSCSACLLGRCNFPGISVHKHLNHIQVTYEYTLTSSK